MRAREWACVRMRPRVWCVYFVRACVRAQSVFAYLVVFIIQPLFEWRDDLGWSKGRGLALFNDKGKVRY